MTRAHDDAPRAIRAIFRRLLSGARGREVLRDLDREYAAVRERGSRAGAGVWYVSQLLHPDTWRLAFALRRLARAAALPGTLPAARGDAGSIAGDAARAPGASVLVNEAFVRRLLGGGNALGRRLRFVPRPESGAWTDEHAAAEAGPWHEVVGVVPNLHASAFDGTYAEPAIYYAMTPELQTATLLVRVRGDDADAFAPRLRELASALDPDLRIDRVTNLARLPNARFLAMASALLRLIVGIVVLLSAAGVHALMSVTVTQRRREVGVRAALGAQPHHLLMNIFSRAGGQLAFGALVGSVLAAALLQSSGLGLIRNAGFVGLVVGVMVLAGLIAALGPALRGLRIHPIEALRGE